MLSKCLKPAARSLVLAQFGISGETRLVAMVANITLGQRWDETHDCQTQELLLQNCASKNSIPENTIKSNLP